MERKKTSRNDSSFRKSESINLMESIPFIDETVNDSSENDNKNHERELKTKETQTDKLDLRFLITKNRTSVPGLEKTKLFHYFLQSELRPTLTKRLINEYERLLCLKEAEEALEKIPRENVKERAKKMTEIECLRMKFKDEDTKTDIKKRVDEKFSCILDMSRKREKKNQLRLSSYKAKKIKETKEFLSKIRTSVEKARSGRQVEKREKIFDMGSNSFKSNRVTTPRMEIMKQFSDGNKREISKNITREEEKSLLEKELGELRKDAIDNAYFFSGNSRFFRPGGKDRRSLSAF